jgi:hypothetical protein
MISNYKQILETLYFKYGSKSNSDISKVTSSHWRQCNEKVTVNKISNIYELYGYGFGNNQKINFLNVIRNIPKRFLLHKLLREYNANNKTIDTANII